MKALGAAVVLLLALTAGAASASVRQHPRLRALNLTPPTFRASGFKPHERVDVTLRGAAVPSVQVMTDAHGRFRARLGAAPSGRAWTVRARGARGGIAVYHHARYASLQTDVMGLVRRPAGNVCSDQKSCSVPAPGVTVQALASGKVVAETTSDHNGGFTFSLADGSYTIQAAGRGTEPKTVHVNTSNPVHLTLRINTGLL